MLRSLGKTGVFFFPSDCLKYDYTVQDLDRFFKMMQDAERSAPVGWGASFQFVGVLAGLMSMFTADP